MQSFLSRSTSSRTAAVSSAFRRMSLGNLLSSVETFRLVLGTSDTQSQIESLGKRFDLLSQELIRALLLSTDITTRQILHAVEGESQVRSLEELCSWISPLDFSKYQEELFSRRQEGTGSWFLESENFISWRDGSGSPRLWCPGIRKHPV